MFLKALRMTVKMGEEVINKGENLLVATLSIIIITTVVVLFLIFVPFAYIWAVNTLFATNIAYNIWTWLATVVIVGLLSNTGEKST